MLAPTLCISSPVLKKTRRRHPSTPPLSRWPTPAPVQKVPQNIQKTSIAKNDAQRLPKTKLQQLCPKITRTSGVGGAKPPPTSLGVGPHKYCFPAGPVLFPRQRRSFFFWPARPFFLARLCPFGFPAWACPTIIPKRPTNIPNGPKLIPQQSQTHRNMTPM